MSLLGDDFKDLLPDTVNVIPIASRNSYGETVAGTPVPYAARVMDKIQISLNDKGEEKMTTIQIIIDTAATIPSDAKIQLPNGSIEPIFAIEVYRDDLNQVHHTVVRV